VKTSDGTTRKTEERMTPRPRLALKGKPSAFLFYLAVALFSGVYLGSFHSRLNQHSRLDSSMDEKAERSLLVEQQLKRLQSKLSDDEGTQRAARE
jgi:hypothetical protein